MEYNLEDKLNFYKFKIEKYKEQIDQIEGGALYSGIKMIIYSPEKETEVLNIVSKPKFSSDQLLNIIGKKSYIMSAYVKYMESSGARVVPIIWGEPENVTLDKISHLDGVLFPGGDGRLVLTNPEDWLTTGVDVEARPPGKRVKRLSLLSGGERSLTAVALLVAIFKARPSPFYVLDEVEAALDDVNLGRLLEVLSELRTDSQLIIVTHQKRTMEIADSLYGVTMRGDGVTEVISQRIREVENA